MQKMKNFNKSNNLTVAKAVGSRLLIDKVAQNCISHPQHAEKREREKIHGTI